MITVFTPAYNRAHTIYRVYESLKSQTYHDFEWIIVDDGSSDDTKKVADRFIAENPFFEIRYFYQTNQGKHIATNRAVREARGEFFITLDSDDGCKPDALECFLKVWDTIPKAEREKYKGVSCRCCKPETPDQIIGTHLSKRVLDSNDHDLRYRYKVKGELWGMTRRQIMLENPYPEIKGLHYYPEGVYWGRIGRNYITRYVDEPLRYYYVDGTEKENQLTKKIHANETYYAREYMMSKAMIQTYFWCDPVNFWMQAVGFIRDGLLTGRSVKQLFSHASATKRGSILFVMAFLPGKLLQVCEKDRNNRY